jgi:hypothetical protein
MKIFSLMATSLLLEKIQNIKCTHQKGKDSIFNQIAPYLPMIKLAEGFLSLTPKVENNLALTIERYFVRINSILSMTQSQKFEDFPLTLNLIEQCLSSARLEVENAYLD